MKRKDDVFLNYKTQIFSTDCSKDDTVDCSYQAQSTMATYMDFVYNGSSITRRYHYEIMKQAQLLLVVFTALFSLVTIFICVMTGVIVFTGKYDASTLIPLLTGLSTDIFAGTLIFVMKGLIKSRDDFFKENIKAEHFSKVIGLIQTIKEDKDKIQFIQKIVDDYCDDNRSPPS